MKPLVAMVGIAYDYDYARAERIALDLVKNGFDILTDDSKSFLFKRQSIAEGAFRAAKAINAPERQHCFTTVMEHYTGPSSARTFAEKGATVHWADERPIDSSKIDYYLHRRNQRILDMLNQSERPGVILFTHGLGPTSQRWCDFVRDALIDQIPVTVVLHWTGPWQHRRIHTANQWNSHLCLILDLTSERFPGRWERFRGWDHAWRFRDEQAGPATMKENRRCQPA